MTAPTRELLIRERSLTLQSLLAKTLGLDESNSLGDLAARARWRHVAAGRLVAGTDDAQAIVSGMAFVVDDREPRGGRRLGPGHIIGARRALGGGGSPGEFVAVRDLIIASLDGEGLRRLIREHPEAAPQILDPRADEPYLKAMSVVALVIAPGIDRRVMSSRLQAALGDGREVALLWPERADAMVDHPGASAGERGEVGDLKVRRLVESLRAELDHVMLEVESRPTPWARRALSMADQVVVIVRSDLDDSGLREVLELLDHSPLRTRRLLVVVHASASERPATNTRHVLDRLGVAHATHVRRGADLSGVARLATGSGRGLVLSGGGARGFAHLGVYRALCELGIDIDLFGGASIGSPLAAGMADGIPPDELDDTVARLFADVLDYTIPVVALVKGGGIARASARVFGDRGIEDLWHRYFCVSTNLTTSTIHRHERGSVVHAIRSSTAIPGVMPPVPHGEELLVDAGLTNNLPVDVMRELTPHGDIIAVDATPMRGPVARANFGLSVSGVEAVRHRMRGRRTHPRITSTLFRALVVGSNQHRSRNGVQSDADLYLDLDLRGVPMLDFGAVREVAIDGYDAAMPALERWLSREEHEPCGT